MKEGKPDALFTGWLELADDRRHAMDAEFRDIFEMSCEKGFKAIIDVQPGADEIAEAVFKKLRRAGVDMRA